LTHRGALAPRAASAWLLIAAALSIASCALPGTIQPAIKIGLSAPFEGLYRDLGYEVLSAVRLAVRQRNGSDGLDGRYFVELVALNDFGEPREAARQAREMAADPDILAVIGGWPSAMPLAASEYELLGVAYLEPPVDAGLLAATAVGWAVLDKGVRRAVLLYGAAPADEELARQVAATLVSYEGSVSLSAADAQSHDWLVQIRLATADLCDLLFVSGSAQEVAAWVILARSSGYAGLILGGPALAGQQAVSMAGGAAEGAFIISHLAPPTADRAFVDPFLAVSGGSPPGPPAGWAYLAANTLLDVLEDTLDARRAPSRDAVRAGLKAQPWPSPAAYLYVVRDGVLQPVGSR